MIKIFIFWVIYIESHKKLPFNRPLVNLVGYGVFFSVLFGIGVSFIPSSDLKTTTDIVIYETELIVGLILFIIVGWLLYKLRK